MENEPENPYEPRPGDRIVRVPRMQPWKIILPGIRRKRPLGFSLLTVVYGFLALIAAGAVLLMLPVSSREGQWTPFLTSLFTSTSSVCVTGLVVVDTLEHWSYFGQAVILLLIQIGGLGIMVSTTIFLVATGRRIGLRGRIFIGESLGASYMGGIIRLVRNIIFFTLLIELLGTLLFYYRFSVEYGWQAGLWKSVFQAVSAFNNAGFDLLGNFGSLSGYREDYLVILTTAALIILGGISFIVLRNIFRSRGLRRTQVDTKLVLLTTVILLALGTLLVLVFEYNNPQTLGPMSLPHKILNAFFLSVTSRTAGFNTVNAGSLTLYTIFFILVLMFIGGAAGSTAGGIKVNTVGIIAMTVWATLKGKEHPGAFGREFPVHNIFRGITLLVIALVWIAVIFLALSFTENFPSINILFETVSAAGTVGLSTGITPALSVPGSVLIMVTMLVGRLGPLALILTLIKVQQPSNFRYPQEIIRIS